MSGDVAAREKALLDEIHELRLLRDAQDPAGPLRVQFQRQIEVKTTALLDLRGNAAEIAELDRRRGQVERQMQAAAADVDAYTGPAGVTGAVGAGMLLLALWLGGGWGWILAAVFLLLSAGAGLVLSVQHRRDNDVLLDQLRGELSRLVSRRDTLMGQGGVPGRVSQDRPAGTA